MARIEQSAGRIGRRIKVFRHRKEVLLLLLALALSPLAMAQDIVTASDYFDLVSDFYRQIEDYQANLVVTQVDGTMRGLLYHKRPNYLLIEFEEPQEQVVAVDGEKLIVYIPYLNVALEQILEADNQPTANLATAQGLELMKSRYSIAYEDSQDLVPLDEGSSEMVRKFKLEWRSIDEGFRQLIVSVNEKYMIRRMKGITSSFEEIQLDFTEIQINQNFPEGKFKYESPPSANVIPNFIFVPEVE